MGHSIYGIVSRLELLRQHSPDLVPDAKIAALRGDFGFLFLDIDADDAEENQWSELARALSAHGPVAVVATEYHGGTGAQMAELWDRQVQIIEPKWSDSDPINAALSWLGVAKDGFWDEFDAVGLDLFRSNHDWAAFVCAEESGQASRSADAVKELE